MKYTTFKKGGYGTGLITTTGGDVYGRVFLSRDPEGAMEAATKNYADLSITALSASSFTTGTLAPARVPEFTGDIVKAVGGLGINYSDTGISTGTYPKISVDRKGRATGGGSLVESDLPDISFSKITSGKPTTLAGYGILDALSVNGGTLSGRLSAQEIGSTGESVINKEFVETGNLGSVTLPLGSVVYKGGKGPFFGFLRANGAAASKTTYADLYSKIGDRYVIQPGAGAGKPWRHHLQINSEQENDLTDWSYTPSLLASRDYTSSFITKNRVYVLGGRDTSYYFTRTVMTAPINPDGTLGAWSYAPQLIQALASTSIVVVNGVIYTIGGSNTPGGEYTQSIHKALILEDGTLSSWSSAGYFPLQVANSITFTLGGKLYLLGGGVYTSSAGWGPLLDIYSCSVSSTGALGTWNKLGAIGIYISYLASRGGGGFFIVGNKVFILSDKLYSVTVNPDGSVSEGSLEKEYPTGLQAGGFYDYVANGRLYLITSPADGNSPSKVITLRINDNGTLGDWEPEITLGLNLKSQDASMVASSDYLYLIGGGLANPIIRACKITGGRNDYSPYFSPGLVETAPTDFRLPNIPQNNLELDAWIKA